MFHTLWQKSADVTVVDVVSTEVRKYGGAMPVAGHFGCAALYEGRIYVIPSYDKTAMYSIKGKVAVAIAKLYIYRI